MLTRYLTLALAFALAPSPGLAADDPPPAYGLFQLYGGDEYPQFRRAMGFTLQDYWAFVDRHVARLDVRFTRTNVLLIWGAIQRSPGGAYDWESETKTDPVIRAVYAPAPGKRMDMLLVLDPATDLSRPVEQQRSYPYGREAEWQAFVRAAVERYDGDGKDDVDSRVRVKHWQVMNEPFSNLMLGLMTVEEYAKLVKLTAQAIRQVDPAARIVLGDVGRDIAGILPLLRDGRWFDAVDTHFYPAGDDYLSPVVGGLRRLLDENGYAQAQVWMAEMGIYRHAPRDPQDLTRRLPARTPAKQARDLVKALLANRATGADRILVVNLVCWSNFGGDPLNLFNFMGLISSGTDSGDAASDLGRERIAYHAFRKLVATTETDVAELIGPRPDFAPPLRVIEFRRRADGRSFFVAWSDGAPASFALPRGFGPARVTSLVPDAAGRFSTRIVAERREGGKVSVGADPLLIEPAGGAAGPYKRWMVSPAKR